MKLATFKSAKVYQIVINILYARIEDHMEKIKKKHCNFEK